jgi:hypothetical protein
MLPPFLKGALRCADPTIRRTICSVTSVAAVRALEITPHVAQKAVGTAIDSRTTRHPGYAISQQKRKLIEQVFFHEFVEPALAEDGMRGSLPRSCCRPAWHSRHHPSTRALCGGLTTEGVGPAFGGELTDASLGMGGDPQQDVLEGLEGRDVHERTALD